MNQAERRAKAFVRPGLVLAWLLLAWCPCALALDPSLQIRQYAHTSWKVRDGFFRGSVYAVSQTPDGYLWLGTEFGLLRFDGVRAVPGQPPAADQTVVAGRIVKLLTARDGTLWIGAETGLASWKDGTLTQYPELDQQRVSSLLEDRQGTVWAGSVGTPAGRLCAIQKGRARCYDQEAAVEGGVAGLYEDRQGQLWVAVPSGLWRWAPGPPKFYPIPDEPGGVRPVGEDEDGSLLIDRRRSVARFVNGRIEPSTLQHALPDDYVWPLLRDREGGLWVPTLHHGLMHAQRGRADAFTESDGLSADTVRDIFEDREGNIWVATLGGLDRFRDVAVPTFTVKQGLLDPLVWSVLATRDGGLWLGTPLGLGRWHEGQTSRFGDQGGMLNGMGPQSLFEDRRGRIWVSTSREFGYLKDDRFVPVSGVPAAFVRGIVEDAGGDIWLITEQHGLIRLRGEAVELIPWAALGRQDFASAVLADPRQGGLWLGFIRGDVAYFSGGRLRVTYSAKDGLGPGHVHSLRFDPQGALWAATEGGLSRLKDGAVATLSSRNGLPCDNMHWSMEDDDRALWLYTACGLVRIARSEVDTWTAAVEKDTHTNLGVQVTVFDISDGVRSNQVFHGYTPRVAKTADGRLWFLPADGLSVIDPRRLRRNELPPPVHIEQIIADHEGYSALQGLRLPSSARDVQLDFTALSFVAPEKVRFRYKLEGYDNDWHEVSNRRQAFYTNLPPGSYRFRVTAANNSGVWNEEGAVLDFSIAPAFYQMTWFRALCAAALLALLFALYRLRVRRVRQQERKLRDVVETMPTVAWSALPDGSIDYVNRSWREYSGLSAGETAGSGWQDAVHPEDLGRHLERWRASLNACEPFESEARFRRADGEYRWFLVRAVPLRDARGKVIKWYGTSTDIEERERLRQLESELAHINRITLLGELTSSIAHEINQPITGAITSAGAALRWLTRDEPNLEKARATVRRIKSDGERAAEIINRLKSFYRKGTPPQREPVDVNEVVSEMPALLRHEAGRRSVAMRTELTNGLPAATADRVQLQQVLMNLMLNGIEAMKEKGGELIVTTRRGDGQVLVSVSDTGDGLPPDKTDQIFNAFFTTKPEGTGMGLAISRTIIESHGGKLWATDNGGPGATFHFTLPTQPEAQT